MNITIDKLRTNIIELVGSWNDPYEEYYSRSNAEMWKWEYPISKYGKEKLVICEVGDDPSESYKNALISILDMLEDKNKKGELVLDRTRSIFFTLDDRLKRFFENLYVQHKDLALWSYKLLYNGKYTVNEVFNMTCKELIKTNKKVLMKRSNMFSIPF